MNSELVYYAVPKINLIQKRTRGQSHHLRCPLRQIIAKIVSTLYARKLKQGTLTIQYSRGFCFRIPRNSAVEPPFTTSGWGWMLTVGSLKDSPSNSTVLVMVTNISELAPRDNSSL